MDQAEFNQLLVQYPRVGFSAVQRIDWGLLDGAQFNTMLARVPLERQPEATRLHQSGYNTRLISSLDRNLFAIGVFVDRLHRVYDKIDPEGYYQYFYQEASSTADWEAIARVYNLLFDKTPAFRLKPALEYVKAENNGTRTYTFTGGDPAADVWREALTQLMVLGFHACPRVAGTALDPTLVTAMLENQFVEQIASEDSLHLGSSNLKIFWRADSRAKDVFVDGRKAEAQVDLAERAAELNLSQRWNPYSSDRVKDALWLRRSSRDNDYYTIVSVGMDFKTSAPFPTLDEAKNPDYLFPPAGETSVKELPLWSAAELSTHRKNLARVMVIEGGRQVEKIRICTKTHAYMSVVNSGFVINTQSYGGGQFPERAVRGMPQDSIVAYLPIMRVHHGGTREAGFTMFQAGTDGPRLLLDKQQLVNRFKRLGAEAVEKAFFDAKTMILGREQLAWSANGSTRAGVALNVQRIIERPLMANVLPTDPRLT